MQGYSLSYLYERKIEVKIGKEKPFELFEGFLSYQSQG